MCRFWELAQFFGSSDISIYTGLKKEKKNYKWESEGQEDNGCGPGGGVDLIFSSRLHSG